MVVKVKWTGASNSPLLTNNADYVVLGWSGMSPIILADNSTPLVGDAWGGGDWQFVSIDAVQGLAIYP